MSSLLRLTCFYNNFNNVFRTIRSAKVLDVLISGYVRYADVVSQNDTLTSALLEALSRIVFELS